MLKNLKYILILSLCLSHQVLARPATLEDADVKVEKLYKNIEVQADGSYIETIEFQIRALKESGKEQIVSYPIVYNKASGKKPKPYIKIKHFP